MTEDRLNSAPSDEAEAEQASPSPELIAKVQELLENTELEGIRPTAISASIEEGVSPGSRPFAVQITLEPSYGLRDGGVGNRFHYTFNLVGEADDHLGSIEFTLQVEYALAADFVPDHEAVAFLAATTGHFAAYPYARELFHSLASRLELDPAVLGLITRNSPLPSTLNAVRPVDTGDA